ncbi:helix-turn-helix domain-containing protein [Methylobacterium oryzisoli]|uniref:helix-turn-helix domain-containing protein n=1 Tax=Methylobacterium oryzisoli TaxID=3385502 RepID=UPI003891CD9D
MRSETRDEIAEAEDTLGQRLLAVMTEMPLSKTEVAEAIGIHRRTLSRWLKSEGTSFRQVVKDARFSLAAQLLIDTNMSLTEISAALEFSEPAAFTRAFRRWTGMTPSVWRRKHRHVERQCAADRPAGARPRQRDRWRKRSSLKNARVRSGNS